MPPAPNVAPTSSEAIAPLPLEARPDARARRCPTCKQAFSGEARFCPFDGDSLAEAEDWNPSADPLLGTTIDGRYEVIAVLGEGGMGTVYEVRHASLGRRFALKVLRRDIADAELAARFIREAKVAAAIGHPNIVAVSDFGEIEIPGDARAKVPYFVMELLSGTSLASLLRVEKTLPPKRAAAILLQCASGLAAAHAAGVVHRDLKPDNVFLTRSGDRELVKLLDFGVAKMAGVGRLTRAGMVFGTPHYMSPEQAAGQGVDHRADIYALGVILYECFAGKVPFEADTYMGVLTKHMFATPEPIERAAPDASRLGALAPIAMRCLAKSPESRFASMEEVSAAIEQATRAPHDAATAEGHDLRGGEPRATDGRPKVATGNEVRLGRLLIAGLVVVSVLLVGLLLVAVFIAVRSKAAPSAIDPPAPIAAPIMPVTLNASPPAAPTAASADAAADAPTPSASITTAAPSVTPLPAAPRAPATLRAPLRTRPKEHPAKGGDVVDPWGR